MLLYLSILNGIALAVLTQKPNHKKIIVWLALLQIALAVIYLLNYYWGDYSIWINDPFPWI